MLIVPLDHHLLSIVCLHGRPHCFLTTPVAPSDSNFPLTLGYALAFHTSSEACKGYLNEKDTDHEEGVNTIWMELVDKLAKAHRRSLGTGQGTARERQRPNSRMVEERVALPPHGLPWPVG